MGKKKISDPHPIDNLVGIRMKQRRAALGLSQSKLAANVGLTFQQIQKYESGKNRVSCSTLYEIARFLKVPINFFFKTVEETRYDIASQAILSDSASASYASSSDDALMIRNLMKIRDPKLRESIAMLINNAAVQESEDASE